MFVLYWTNMSRVKSQYTSADVERMGTGCCQKAAVLISQDQLSFQCHLVSIYIRSSVHLYTAIIFLIMTFIRTKQCLTGQSGPSEATQSIHQTSPIPKEKAHRQRQSNFWKLCRGKSSVEGNWSVQPELPWNPPWHILFRHSWSELV